MESKEYFIKKIENKLILASRNIQVGDKIFTDDYAWPNDVELIWEQQNKDMNEPYIEESYKIVAEVSKDAIFIKEGDTFSEKEIKIIKDKKIINFDSQMDWTHAEYEQYIKCVQVKCDKCQTFH